MATFAAVFVGLTILDIAGRPVVAIPPRGGVAFIEQIRLNPAGTAAGANINAAKLGIRTAAVACLGEDEKADFILASYARLGIDCSLIQRTALKETSATILPIRPNGERPALHCRGASDALFVSEAEFDAVLDCRFLHHGGTGLLAAMDKGQSARLLQAAKARGVTTSFDLIAPNEETLELLRPLLPSVDYFMPSLEEAAFLSGETQPVVSTASTGHGAICCGDSYCGGFIAALARGLSVKAACDVASAVAALGATGMGSDAGVVDWEQTQAFMAAHRP